METIQQNWAAAIRKTCDSNRATIHCAVTKTGDAALIKYSSVKGWRLVRISDCREVALESFAGLLVSEEVADALETLAAEMERQAEIDRQMAAWQISRDAAKRAGRWKDGTFRTRGHVQAGG